MPRQGGESPGEELLKVYAVHFAGHVEGVEQGLGLGSMDGVIGLHGVPEDVQGPELGFARVVVHHSVGAVQKGSEASLVVHCIVEGLPELLGAVPQPGVRILLNGVHDHPALFKEAVNHRLELFILESHHIQFRVLFAPLEDLVELVEAGGDQVPEFFGIEDISLPALLLEGLDDLAGVVLAKVDDDIEVPLRMYPAQTMVNHEPDVIIQFQATVFFHLLEVLVEGVRHDERIFVHVVLCQELQGEH